MPPPRHAHGSHRGAAEISRHYQLIADHYMALAEAEELLARAPPASGASRDGQSQR